jgi:uncharacterized protein with PQ loop repeat
VVAFGDDALTAKARELVVGITVNINVIFFYGAPLSSILTVLRTKSTATIHIPTLITNTANGAFWCAYGVAVLDPFIAVPNGVGAALGGVQAMLFVLFGAKKKKPGAISEEAATCSLPSTPPLPSKGAAEADVECAILGPESSLHVNDDDNDAVVSSTGVTDASNDALEDATISKYR